MLESKTLILFSVIGAAIAALIAMIPTTEPFWNTPSKTWKVEKVLGMPSTKANGCTTQDFFQSPNFQSLLAPRFSNVDYGPNLRTKFPGYSMMGVPQDPLNYENQKKCVTFAPNTKEKFGYGKLKEGYGNSYDTVYSPSISGPVPSVTKMTASGKLAPAGVPINPKMGSVMNMANGNYHQVVDSLASCSTGAVPTDTVMESTTPFLTPDGEMKNPIVYDRYIFANRSSRLRSQGDPIRGDLPIVPQSGNWFTPSVHPNIDLQAGALNVLAGVNNDTSKQLANLIYNSSGNADTTIGGVNMADVNVAGQTLGTLSAAQGDVQISAFP
jgi:hypothetical protein